MTRQGTTLVLVDMQPGLPASNEEWLKGAVYQEIMTARSEDWGIVILEYMHHSPPRFMGETYQYLVSAAAGNCDVFAMRAKATLDGQRTCRRCRCGEEHANRALPRLRRECSRLHPGNRSRACSALPRQPHRGGRSRLQRRQRHQLEPLQAARKRASRLIDSEEEPAQAALFPPSYRFPKNILLLPNIIKKYFQQLVAKEATPGNLIN